MTFLTLTSKGVNFMYHNRTGVIEKKMRKNYLSRYRKLIKLEKTHFNKWIDVSKELDSLQPLIEKLRK